MKIKGILPPRIPDIAVNENKPVDNTQATTSIMKFQSVK